MTKEEDMERYEKLIKEHTEILVNTTLVYMRRNLEDEETSGFVIGFVLSSFVSAIHHMLVHLGEVFEDDDLSAEFKQLMEEITGSVRKMSFVRKFILKRNEK